MVEGLTIRGAQSILETDFGEMDWVVEGLLAPGLSMIVSPPKFGKSYMMLNLGVSVVAGEPFWGLKTKRCGVLYLALEDTYRRISARLSEITDETSDDFSVAVRSEGIANGLMEQLEDFVKAYPGTGLVMLDTLQIVRSGFYDSAYAADYADLRVLKTFADEHSLALLVVHHTRKARDASDPFANISGTNGLMGACDTVFVLDKDKRSDRYATLSVTGRDVEHQELRLLFENGQWEFVEMVSEEELEQREVPKCIYRVIDFLRDRPQGWEGTASDLIAEAGLDNVRVSVLGKQLSSFRQYLLDSGIRYRRERTGSARMLRFELEASVRNDGSDEDDGKAGIPLDPSHDCRRDVPKMPSQPSFASLAV